jgi:hypothetical protein
MAIELRNTTEFAGVILRTAKITISQDNKISSQVDLRQFVGTTVRGICSSVLVQMPGTFTGTQFFVQVSCDEGITFQRLQDGSGNDVVFTAAANKAVPIGSLGGATHFKIEAVTAQAQDDIFTLCLSGGQPAIVRSGITTVVDTELPAAAALADATANPTTSQIGAALEGYNGTTWDRVRSAGDNADAVATATLGELFALARNTLFNGATWDRQYSQAASINLLTLSARTATTNTATQTNYNWRGVLLVIFCSAKAAATTLQVNLTEPTLGGGGFAQAPAAGFNLAAGAAMYVLFYPGIAAAGADLTACLGPTLTTASVSGKSVTLPRNWGVTIVHGDANSITYNVNAYMLL